MDTPEQGTHTDIEAIRTSSNTPTSIAKRVPHPVRWLASIGVVLFLIAPWQPALELVKPDGNRLDYPGWPLLFFGWLETLSVLNGRTNAIGWLANPAFVVGTIAIFLGKTRIAFASMLTAVCFSLSSVLLIEVMLDEGGNTARVSGYHSGFWIWVTAIGWNFVLASLSLIVTRRNYPA